MQNKEQLVQDLVTHSKKSSEFDFEYKSDFIKIASKKDSITTLVIYIILMLAIPIVMSLTDADLTVKSFVSILWIIVIGIRYYRIVEKNKDLIIDLKNKELITTTFISGICIRQQHYKISDISEIKVKEFIASNSKYGNGLKFYEVFALIKNESVPVCLVENNSVANKIRKLITLIITK